MVSIFCVRLPAAFCIWYQKVVLQGVPGMIIRYHFIMPCLPISAGTPKSTVSISFPIVLIGLDNKTRKHSIFRHDNFIGCFSADKIVKAENRMVTQDALKCILKVRMYFNLRHVSASAMLTKVELPKR